MASTLSRPQSNRRAHRPPGPAPTGVVRGPGRNRRMPWIALGVLLIAGAIVGFALFTISQASRTLVWVSAVDIPAGATIERSQLSLVAVGADPGVRLLPRGQESTVLGGVARNQIPAGTPLSRALVVPPQEVVPAGQAVVGAELKRGQYPTSRLAAGDRVQLVATATAGRPADDALSLGTATVWAIEPPTRSAPDSLFVSLLVPADRVTLVANVAGEDHLRLVMVNSGSDDGGVRPAVASGGVDAGPGPPSSAVGPGPTAPVAPAGPTTRVLPAASATTRPVPGTSAGG